MFQSTLNHTLKVNRLYKLLKKEGFMIAQEPLPQQESSKWFVGVCWNCGLYLYSNDFKIVNDRPYCSLECAR